MNSRLLNSIIRPPWLSADVSEHSMEVWPPFQRGKCANGTGKNTILPDRYLKNEWRWCNHIWILLSSGKMGLIVEGGSRLARKNTIVFFGNFSSVRGKFFAPMKVGRMSVYRIQAWTCRYNRLILNFARVLFTVSKDGCPDSDGSEPAAAICGGAWSPQRSEYEP